MQMQQMIDGIQTYHPRSKFNPITIHLMLIFGGVAGIATAFVVHLIWQATGFYLIVLFPAAIGFTAGIGLSIGIHMGKCRNVYISVMVNLGIGILSYVAMHFFDSRSYDGSPDLLTYLEAMANEGYTIFFIPLSGPFAWITWIIEVGIVAFLAVMFGGGSSSSPFCETCNQWTDGDLSMYASNGSVESVITALNNQEYGQIIELRDPKVGERNRLELHLEFCDKCNETGYMTVTNVSPEGDDDNEEQVLVSAAKISEFGIGNLLQDFRALSPASE